LGWRRLRSAGASPFISTGDLKILRLLCLYTIPSEGSEGAIWYVAILVILGQPILGASIEDALAAANSWLEAKMQLSMEETTGV
jgi:hypothetical protein